MNYYPDWQAAAESCKQRKAISESFFMRLDGGRLLRVCIVKPIHGDPKYVYASCPGIPVRGLGRPTASDCDRIRRWKPW